MFKGIMRIGISLILVFLTAGAAWGLNPARLIKYNGSPTEPGTVTISIDDGSIYVAITAGMTCDAFCQAVKAAAIVPTATEFWKSAEIDCLHNGYCYVRIRDGRGGHHCDHIAEPTVTESDPDDGEGDDTNDIAGASFAGETLSDALFKISGIKAPVIPEKSGPLYAEWQVSVTVEINGVSVVISITVDDVVEGQSAGDHPSTPAEVIEALRAAIDGHADLTADKNDDGQIFVYIEGPEVKIIKFLDSSNHDGTKMRAHPLLLSVEPSSGHQGGGAMISLYGSYLGPNALITFGGEEALIISYDTTTDVYEVASPQYFGTGNVDVVAIPEGEYQDEYNTLYGGFYYYYKIPTLSEWGLIIFSLLVLTLVTVVVTRQRLSVAAGGVNVSSSMRGPLFFPKLYQKTLTATLAVAIVALAIAYTLSETVPLRDIVGTVISAGIVAYIVHLWFARRDQ